MRSVSRKLLATSLLGLILLISQFATVEAKPAASVGAHNTSLAATSTNHHNTCMPLRAARRILNKASHKQLQQRIDWAINHLNIYVTNHPGVAVYGNAGTVAWRSGVLPQNATVLLWTDTAGTRPKVMTPGHTRKTDFRRVWHFTQHAPGEYGWGLFIEFGPLKMRSPYGGALMCGQFDWPDP